MAGPSELRALASGFLNFHGKPEIRTWNATSPPVYFPADLKKLDVGALPQVQSGGGDATIEFLRKPEERLRSPVLAVGGSPNRHVQRFLFQYFFHPQDQNKILTRPRTEIESSTLAIRFHGVIGGYQMAKCSICGRSVSHFLGRFRSIASQGVNRTTSPCER
jgi:hypothetical protein